ncbi:protein kinase family protein [Lysinibacillus fusiformis]|uniref:protein kinase family protein n=1 Tax=Lysinibacillus fusiformis TaxID=28031 RepID=UPI003CEE2D30
MNNLETFLRIKTDELATIHKSNKAILYQDFYSNITPSNLGQIFANLHCAFNELFSFMNSKNGYGGHYNAHESRQLLETIDFFEILKAKLKTLNSEFQIDEYYADIISICKKFLKASGGSPIPEDFFDINVIDNKPIFKLTSSISLKTQNESINMNLNVVGEGSYAHVFSFIDPNLGIKVALKRAKKNLDSKEITRFNNEFNDLKTLDSPFIVKAYKYNEVDNSYTMEFIDKTLDSFISEYNSKITYKERRILIVQLFKAFKHIHRKKILHRDISYTNILVKTYDDSSQILKVADLGLVKRENSTLTGYDTPVKGSLNDHSDLERIGFDNYAIEHETFVLTKIVYFILSGKKALHKERDIYLKTFIDKGTSPDKEQRFKSVEDLEDYLATSVYPNLKL